MDAYNRPRVLVVDDDTDLLDLVGLILERDYEVVTATTGEAAYSLATSCELDAAIVDIMLPGVDGLTLCQRLRKNDATRLLPILVLTAKVRLEDKAAGYNSGANEFMTKPFNPEELRCRVQMLIARSRHPRRHTRGPNVRGRTIAVFSTNGGVGKTLIATNLSLALVQETRKRVALFDADMRSGETSLHLNLSPKQNLMDLVPLLPQVDSHPELIESMLTAHPSGLKVLASPSRLFGNEVYTLDQARMIMTALSRQFDYLVVDCDASFEDRTLVFLEHADAILLIITPEMGPLKNTSLFVEQAERFGLSRDLFHLVLNRANSKVGIDPEEVARFIKMPIQFRVPSGGRELVLSVNRGHPFILKHANHPFSHQIRGMAKALSQELAHPQPVAPASQDISLRSAA